MDLYLDRLPEQDAEFRKEAAFGARLSEAPENWPQELTSELLKQLPFLSDYDLNVNLDRVDPGRGFAFGYADVANKTERPEVEHAETGLPHIRIPLITVERSVKPFRTFLDGEAVMPLTEDRIRETLFNPTTFDLSQSMPRDPSLVEPLMPPTRSGAGYGGEYKMASAEYHAPIGMTKEAFLGITKTTFSKGFGGLLKTNPNSEELNRAFALYRKKTGKDVKEMTYADIDQYVQSLRGKEKKSSARPDLLHAIAPTMSEKDVERFIDKVASDATIRAGLQRAGVAEELVEVFDKTKRASAEERLAYLADSIEPTVVTIHKFPGGDFLVKSANVNAFDPGPAQGEVIPPEEAAEAIGPENAEAMVPGQTATMVSAPVMPQEPVEFQGEPVTQFGEYKVIDTLGNQSMGWVFPETLAWDGNFTPQPVALFTNGSAFAVQDSIVGEMVGKGTNLPIDRPIGEGCFYTIGHGEAIATAPLTVKSMMAGPDGQPKIMGEDLFGNVIQIGIIEGLSSPQRISDIEYALPTSWKFMRLNNQTQLQGGGNAEMEGPEAGLEEGMGGMSDAPAPQKPAAKKPGGEKKPEKKDAKGKEEKKPGGTKVEVNVNEKAKQEKTSAVLWYNGGFNIDGGCGLRKIAADYRFDMSPVDAEFMLGLLGVDGLVAKQKVAEARRKGSVKLAGLKTITLLSERYQESVKTASALLQQVPDLRRDLIKEAASLQDPSSVNNLLALNFINPENLNTFIHYIPELEETAEHLAEMLLFNHLGMNELPEGAIERAMRNTEEVLTSLKNLAEVDVEEDEG